jgi:hypothetical protein
MTFSGMTREAAVSCSAEVGKAKFSMGLMNNNLVAHPLLGQSAKAHNRSE